MSAGWLVLDLVCESVGILCGLTMQILQIFYSSPQQRGLLLT